MLKNISRLEYKIGERVYQLTCDNDSPLPDVKEALCQFLKYVGMIEDQVKAATEKAKEEQAKEEQDSEVKPDAEQI